MSIYHAEVHWLRNHQEFINNRYSRAHRWDFDGGVSVPASASPQIVPLPFSVAENVDPEEAFVASLASCHMLFFLSVAAKRKFQVDSYIDKAEGTLALNGEGKQAMTQVILKPVVIFSGDKIPNQQQIEKLHHLAHENCFIANSVKTAVIVDCKQS